MGLGAKPLVINGRSPGYVRRAYRIVMDEFGIDLKRLPMDDWCPILVAACDNEDADGMTFREAVIGATRAVANRRFIGEGE